MITPKVPVDLLNDNFSGPPCIMDYLNEESFFFSRNALENV